VRARKRTTKCQRCLYKLCWFLNSESLVGLNILPSHFCWKSLSPSRILSLDSLQRSTYNVLWLICMYSYLRNISEVLHKLLIFKFLILIASFYGIFAFAYPRQSLWSWPQKKGCSFGDLRWYRHTPLSENLYLKDCHLYFPFFVFLEEKLWSQPYCVCWVTPSLIMPPRNLSCFIC